MPKITNVKSARQRRNPDGTPKPLNTCDMCAKEIEVGAPYKHMSIKTGPISSRTLIRCDVCPPWQVWEYSNSTSARIAKILDDTNGALWNAETEDDASGALSETADAIRELAQEKRESAQNMEDGFGHSTSLSEELTDLADQLDEWAYTLENATVPDFPDPADAECETCDGKGTGGEDTDTCPDCEGTGHPAEVTEVQIDEWRTELTELSELDDSPV